MGGAALDISTSSGSSTASAAIPASTRRSAQRGGLPAGNSPISPVPATTLALPVISAATSTSQADAVAPRPTAPISPATKNGAGPTSTQPAQGRVAQSQLNPDSRGQRAAADGRQHDARFRRLTRTRSKQR